MAKKTQDGSLDVSEFVVVVDTREQNPYGFGGFKEHGRELLVRRTFAGLRTGDYSIEGHESEVTVERKSVTDFLQCMGHERDRFEREIERMRGMAASVVVVEGEYRHILESSCACSQCRGQGKMYVFPANNMLIDNWDLRATVAAVLARHGVLLAMDCDACGGTGKAAKGVHPASVAGTIAGWSAKYGTRWMFAGDRLQAEAWTFRFLRAYWRSHGLARTETGDRVQAGSGSGIQGDGPTDSGSGESVGLGVSPGDG